MDLALGNPELLSLAAGFTDTDTLPVEAVQQAMAELAALPGRPDFLQYGNNQGRTALRRLLAERLCAQEGPLEPESVVRQMFVTNGSQQALYLAMQVLCDPGDIVLVDRPSYFVYLEMLSGLGVKAKSMPVDGGGRIDGPALRELLRTLQASGESQRLRAVYFVSYFSNPSGRSLQAAEKATIARELAAAGVYVPVIEDAAYRELYFETPEPATSVMTQPEWAEFPRLYLSTLTKPFASGLKIGYGICSDPEWLSRMLHLKGHHDFGSAHLNQAVCERVLGDGGFDRQLGRIRPSYQAKMRSLHEALRLGGLQDHGWSWQEPAGGLYLWLQAPEQVDTGLDHEFCRAAVEAGVLYVPGDLCFGDDIPRKFARLSFGVLPPKQLTEAGRRFAAVARKFS